MYIIIIIRMVEHMLTDTFGGKQKHTKSTTNQPTTGQETMLLVAGLIVYMYQPLNTAQGLQLRV